MAEPTKVFLSYAREDEVEVERLYERLLEDGLKPWMSKRDILPGEDWERSITKAVRGADFFLVCLTSRSLAKRGFLQKEIKQALEIWREKLEDDIYLIPVRLELCQVPDALLKFQWVDMFAEDGYRKLRGALWVGSERLRNGRIQLSQTGKNSISTRKLVEHDPEGLAYSIEIRYPQIDPAGEDWAREINTCLAGFAFGMAQKFRKDSLAVASVGDARKFRIESKMIDELNVDFKVSLFTQRFVSIRFLIWTYGAGAAHPNSHTRTHNFLIPLVLELEFADLFLPGSDYLKKISEYCIADLHRQVARELGLSESEYRSDNWIIEGAGPKCHNFDAWVLAKTGLLIIFDPYRASCYAAGTREVNIGIEVLKDLLKEDVLSVLHSPE
jgi:hypothetical protein